MIRALACLLVAAVAGASSAQKPAAPEPARHYSLDRSFSLILPPAWRQLTPDEARILNKRPGAALPADLLSPRQPVYYPYGDVTRWLQEGFDGRCMTISQVDGEPPEGEAALQDVRDRAGETELPGWSRAVTSASWSTLGDGEHAVIECTTELALGTDQRPLRALQLLIPTGGKTLILGFRSWADEFDAALAGFRRVAATIKVLRPARGPRKLGDHLFYPVVIGVLVGVMLLLLRRRASS